MSSTAMVSQVAPSSSAITLMTHAVGLPLISAWTEAARCGNISLCTGPSPAPGVSPLALAPATVWPSSSRKAPVRDIARSEVVADVEYWIAAGGNELDRRQVARVKERRPSLVASTIHEH